MKNLIIIMLSIFTISCSSQVNILTANDYQNVKFDNTLLSDILSTEGDNVLLRNLFVDNFTMDSGYEPDYWVQFETASIYFYFKME